MAWASPLLCYCLLRFEAHAANSQSHFRTRAPIKFAYLMCALYNTILKNEKSTEKYDLSETIKATGVFEWSVITRSRVAATFSTNKNTFYLLVFFSLRDDFVSMLNAFGRWISCLFWDGQRFLNSLNFNECNSLPKHLQYERNKIIRKWNFEITQRFADCMRNDEKKKTVCNGDTGHSIVIIISISCMGKLSFHARYQINPI